MDIAYELRERFDDGIINKIYSFVGVHPLAELMIDREQKEIDAYFDELWQQYLDVYAAFMFGAI